MNLRALVAGAVLSVVGLGVMAAPAQAQYRSRYDDYRYYQGRDRFDIARRQALRSEFIRVARRVEDADRRGDISRSEANRLFDRLDNVRDFLRSDRNVSDSEFDRRRAELRRIEDRLGDLCGPSRSRYDDRYRYNDRYRNDDRYRSDDRYRYDDRYRDRYRR